MAINYGTANNNPVAYPALSQQKFGLAETQSPAGVHAPIPAATVVPGVGVLGADLGGYVKGDMLAQQYNMNNREDQRESEKLGLAKEKFGLEKDYLKIAQAELGIKMDDQAMEREAFSWKRKDRAQEDYIQQGMQQAAEQGGYGGVIDFLKTADPFKAVQFHAEKIKLDQSIMSTDVMRAVAPNEIGKAKLEAYGVIGKMGRAIMQAEPADQEKMFRTMRPMMEQVFGKDGAPNSLAEALPMYMLAVAQATPENQLFESNKTSMVLQSDLGKTTAALAELKSKGFTPENNQLALDLQGKLEGLRADSMKAQAQVTEITAKKNANLMASAKDEGTLRAQQMAVDKDLSTRYLKETKDAGEFIKEYGNFNAAYENYKQNPNAVNQTAMNRTLAMIYAGGKMSDNDAIAFSGSDSTTVQLLKKVRSTYETSGMVVANPSEVERLHGLMSKLYEDKTPKLREINKRFKSLEKTAKVTDGAIPYYDVPEPKTEEPQYSPLELQKMAQEALIKQPHRKEEIMKKLQSMMPQQEGQ